jgi:hypothetical protein
MVTETDYLRVQFKKAALFHQSCRHLWKQGAFPDKIALNFIRLQHLRAMPLYIGLIMIVFDWKKLKSILRAPF